MGQEKLSFELLKKRRVIESRSEKKLAQKNDVLKTKK